MELVSPSNGKMKYFHLHFNLIASYAILVLSDTHLDIWKAETRSLFSSGPVRKHALLTCNSSFFSLSRSLTRSLRWINQVQLLGSTATTSTSSNNLPVWRGRLQRHLLLCSQVHVFNLSLSIWPLAVVADPQPRSPLIYTSQILQLTSQ